MIKTINLNGSEIKVTELGGDNTEIFNNNNDIVYASKLPNITIGGDNVIAIPAGAIDGLYGTHGTIYLLGTGSVELRGVDHKVTKVRGQSTSRSGGGVSESYVDEKFNEILESANAYADIKNSEVIAGLKEYADEKDIETLDCAKEYTNSLNAELAGYIGYTESDIYGLEADFENNVFTRLAGAVGKNAGADFDSVNAYGGRRRCNLSDDGEVLAYYGDENFKADGSNGQVMVEQPKFYYRTVPLKTEKINGADGYHLRKARYYISDTPKAGFKVHPAFVRNGVEADKIYLSAFEGSIYDASAGSYLLEDEQIADFDNDKLSSIARAKPCAGVSQALTKSNAQKLAHNRGDGWELMTIRSISATQLLFIVEYASFNAQHSIGVGSAAKKDDGNNNMAEKTGTSLSLNDKSGTVQNNEKIQIVSYRGEENLWGNIWTMIDGVKYFSANAANSCGEIFIAKNAASAEDYDRIDIYPKIGKGYISAYGYSSDYDWLFIPTELNGNNLAPVGDWYRNQKDNWRGVLLGGSWNDGMSAGIFYWHFESNVNGNDRSIGVRLFYNGV